MHSFRLRLILALVACVTAVSIASTYFEVLAHKHFLREDLLRRSNWMGASIQPDLEQKLAAGAIGEIPALLDLTKARTGALGLAVFQPQGRPLAWSGSSNLAQSLAHAAVERSLRKGTDVNVFGRTADTQWLEESIPLHNGNQLEGALVLISDATYIRTESYDLW